MVSIPTTWLFLAFVVPLLRLLLNNILRAFSSDQVPAKRRKLHEAAGVKGGAASVEVGERPRPGETSTPDPVEGAPQEGAAVPLVGAPEPQTVPPEPLLADRAEETAPAPSRALTPPRAATPPREAILLRTPPSPRAATPPPASPSPCSPAAPVPLCEGAAEASVDANAATGGGAASSPLGGANEVPAGVGAAAGGGAGSPPRSAGEDEHPRDSGAAAAAGVEGGEDTPSPRARNGASRASACGQCGGFNSRAVSRSDSSSRGHATARGSFASPATIAA